MPFSMTQNPLSCCSTVPKQGFEHKELTWLWERLGNIFDPDYHFVALCDKCCLFAGSRNCPEQLSWSLLTLWVWFWFNLLPVLFWRLEPMWFSVFAISFVLSLGTVWLRSPVPCYPSLPLSGCVLVFFSLLFSGLLYFWIWDF